MKTAVSIKNDLHLVIRYTQMHYTPGLAYRRSAKFSTEKLRTVKYPYCSKNLAVLDEEVSVDIFRAPRKAEVRCDEYKRCNYCQQMVGIVFKRAG
jgi:hypothetical protein